MGQKTKRRQKMRKSRIQRARDKHVNFQIGFARYDCGQPGNLHYYLSPEALHIPNGVVALLETNMLMSRLAVVRTDDYSQPGNLHACLQKHDHFMLACGHASGDFPGWS